MVSLFGVSGMPSERSETPAKWFNSFARHNFCPMRTLAFVLILLGASQGLMGQSYYVDVPEPFRTPEFLSIGRSGDICGFASQFWGELERAGYNVVTDAQAAQLRMPPKVEVNEQVVLVEVYRILSTAIKVDPSILPMQRRKLLRYLVDSGVTDGTDLAVQEGIRQGVFVSLPDKMVALNPEAVAPSMPETTDAPWTPPQVYKFTFNYTYRDSYRCGRTATELRAAINDLETGETLCSMRFEQPQLAGRCPADIAHGLIQRLKGAAHYDLDVNLGRAPLSASTILTIGEGSGDCERRSGASWMERLGAELMTQYTLVDREQVDQLIKEQKQDLADETFADSELIEAGKLLGAEAMLFGEVQCRAGKTIADVKLISTTSGAALWTAHGENASPAAMAEYVLHELNALSQE